ncbi:hypothetical protein IU450_25330 [Nocardia abscessus]|uniref:hypothetical protein n=1 Tax=Nocardia abscessus TaxID=120957 RepID=UPI0018930C59|nr:hypothetical protein [Nocardia abscessus]MBF6339190.1 hypothetical protein [Nocardia abscessus]
MASSVADLQQRLAKFQHTDQHMLEPPVGTPLNADIAEVGHDNTAAHRLHGRLHLALGELALIGEWFESGSGLGVEEIGDQMSQTLIKMFVAGLG